MSKEEMKLSMNVNGQSKVPPGFRFHPTEEELLQYYLRKKAANEKIDLDVIQAVDLNKLEPWDIQEKCNLGSKAQNSWYFFSHKDKKYPTSTRTNRATAAGFWKATGRDKVIRSSFQIIGMRKTLVFYKGRAPHGQKSDWIMHEYRLDDIINIADQDSKVSNKLCDSTREEAWVVCRLFTKKNYHKSFEAHQRSLSGSMDTRAQLQSSNNDAMKQFMNPINDTFVHIPRLDSPTMTTSLARMRSSAFDQGSSVKSYNIACDSYDQYSNWADVDKFVAYQLDGQIMGTKYYSSCCGESDEKLCFPLDCINEPVFSWPEEDVWSLDRSSIDPLYYLSVECVGVSKNQTITENQTIYNWRTN